MTKFILLINPELALVCLPLGAAGHYSLQDAAQASGVHPELLLYYSRLGLIPIQRRASNGEIFFDAHALAEIRRIDHYRRHLGINRRALPLLCELRREGERRGVALSFLGEPAAKPVR